MAKIFANTSGRTCMQLNLLRIVPFHTTTHSDSSSTHYSQVFISDGYYRTNNDTGGEGVFWQ